GEEADHEAERHAKRDREPQHGPRADAEGIEEGARRIGADAYVERVAERELPGESHHHVPRLAGVGEVENQRCHREGIASGKRRQCDQQRSEDGERDRAPVHVRRPSSPCGRSSKTRISSPKLNMLFAEGSMKSPASASDTPMRTPPSSAPPMEPRPP